jgi:hypothetical protein
VYDQDLAVALAHVLSLFHQAQPECSLLVSQTRRSDEVFDRLLAELRLVGLEPVDCTADVTRGAVFRYAWERVALFRLRPAAELPTPPSSSS